VRTRRRPRATGDRGSDPWPLSRLGLGPSLVPPRGATGPGPCSRNWSENSPQTSCHRGPRQWPVTAARRTRRIGLGLGPSPRTGPGFSPGCRRAILAVLQFFELKSSSRCLSGPVGRLQHLFGPAHLSLNLGQPSELIFILKNRIRPVPRTHCSWVYNLCFRTL